jgi:electron transport complex, RnfABCDGE type, D subunit
MQKKLQVSSSPHLRDNSSTKKVMLDVCIALAPAGLAAIYFFGLRSLSLIIVTVLSAVVSEWAYQKATHQRVTIGDLSAVVTGLLVAYNLPANAPAWVGIAGGAIAIVLIKQLFGGIGANFMNPALASRAILFVSFATIMSQYPNPAMNAMVNQVDTIASATPLASVAKNSLPQLLGAVQGAAGEASSLPPLTGLWDLFIGNVPGVLGETSKLAILLGGLYLLVRRVIDWRIPVTFIATVFLCYLIKDDAQIALYQILSGGLFLGAFFMATDYATSPITKWGKIVMGIGCGFVLFVIRAYAAYPEGCSFAILFMNVATPLIDKMTLPHSFGEVKQHG